MSNLGYGDIKLKEQTPLSSTNTERDRQGMPDTADSDEPYDTVVFPYTHGYDKV